MPRAVGGAELRGSQPHREPKYPARAERNLRAKPGESALSAAMARDGAGKALAGLTTVAEVRRVTYGRFAGE